MKRRAFLAAGVAAMAAPHIPAFDLPTPKLAEPDESVDIKFRSGGTGKVVRESMLISCSAMLMVGDHLLISGNGKTREFIVTSVYASGAEISSCDEEAERYRT